MKPIQIDYDEPDMLDNRKRENAEDRRFITQ